MTEGERILHDAIVRLTQRALLIAPLRSFIDAGASAAEGKISATTAAVLTKVLAKRTVVDSLGAEVPMSKEAIASMAAETAAKGSVVAKQAVEAAELVFFQALTDATATDCCKALVHLDRKSCLEHVKKKKFEIGELSKQGVAWIENSALESWISGLDRASLPDRVQLIYAICQPGQKPSKVEDYRFNHDRLVRLDKLRHEVVHEAGVTAISSLGVGDLDFMLLTGFHLTLMVMECFGIEPDYVYTSARIFEHRV